MTKYVCILPKTTQTQQQSQVVAKIKRKKRLYICTECQTNFTSYNALKAHEKDCHSLDNETSALSICKYCNALYAGAELLAEHVAEVHDDGKYMCKCCEKRFATTGHLRNHAVKVHGYKTLQYYCTLCTEPAKFDGKSDINEHFRQQHKICSRSHNLAEVVRHDGDDYIGGSDDDNVEMLDLEWLDDCIDTNDMSLTTTLEGLDFDWDNVLNSVGDIRTATPTTQTTPGASFVCPICECACSKALALLKHICAEHETVSELTCVFCNKEFDKLINYKRHLERMHTLLPRHECFFCQRLFTNLDHLKKHVLSLHQNERRFNCSQCDAAFMQSGHLRQHMETHTGLKRFSCLHCDRSFWRSIDLSRHKCKSTDSKLS